MTGRVGIGQPRQESSSQLRQCTCVPNSSCSSSCASRATRRGSEALTRTKLQMATVSFATILLWKAMKVDVLPGMERSSGYTKLMKVLELGQRLESQQPQACIMPTCIVLSKITVTLG